MLNCLVVSILNTVISSFNIIFKPILLDLQSLLRRFLKRDVFVVSPVKLVKFDVMNQKLWGSPKQVDIGMGATVALKVIID